EARTRGAIDVRARAIGAELTRRGLVGRRVLLLYVPGIAFIEALYGCLYAGAVAVPAYPPDPARLQRTLPRLQAVVADCEPALVLTSSGLLQMAPFVFGLAPELATVGWEATDLWGDDAAWEPPRHDPADLALIQYTSGSTAVPKGVEIGHDNLIANLRQLRAARRGGEHTVIANWLPFYHDLGLIGTILQPAFLGGRAIQMSPIDFLKRPLRWLQMVDRHRADTSAGPTFALDLVVRKVTPDDVAGLDLSCWTMALIGAEPLRHASIEAFLALLGPRGLRREAIFQGYGLAEGVLASVCGQVDAAYRWGSFDAAALRRGRAVPRPEGAPGSQTLVSCGRVMEEQRVEVVDPGSDLPVPDGRVGELWIAGPNVARGYWRRPEETAATFGARIGGEGPFLRTGDLGVRLDGEVWVTGRLKDLVILDGRNHYPQDLEASAERAHPWVRPGGAIAFSDDDGRGERLVVVVEVEERALPADGRDEALASVSASIRRELGESHGVAVHRVVLVRPGQIPKTSSGKLMRAACRDELLRGRLEELARSEGPARAAAAPREVTSDVAWLVERVALHLGVAQGDVDPDAPLAELGLDSKGAVALVLDLEELLGRSLASTVVYDHPTIHALAGFLASDRAARAGGGEETR
ncbi:MAG TPA: AMP-binding protein, partial [Myxococcota bacterium]|nr:AMP-binding protein [Myxococcota bacterium]